MPLTVCLLLCLLLCSCLPRPGDAQYLWSETSAQSAGPGRLCGHTGVYANGSVAVFGGIQGVLGSVSGGSSGGQDFVTRVVSDLWFFSVTIGVWRHGVVSSPWPPALAYASAVVTNPINPGPMYLFGGYDVLGNFSNSVWCMGTHWVLPAWQLIQPSSADAPAPRAQQAMAAFNNDSFVIYGGQNSTTVMGDAWLFNTTTLQWMLLVDSDGFAFGVRYGFGPSLGLNSSGPPHPQPRFLANLIAMPGTPQLLLVNGAYDNSIVYNETSTIVWLLTPATGSWQSITTSGDAPSKVAAGGAVVSNGLLYTFMGKLSAIFETVMKFAWG